MVLFGDGVGGCGDEGVCTSMSALPTLAAASYRSSSRRSRWAAIFLQVSCSHTELGFPSKAEPVWSYGVSKPDLALT